MIVIASHDKIDLLINLLNQLHQINLNGHQILVVDTNSTNVTYLSGLEDLKSKYNNVLFDRKDYDCFDSGAYIYAYKNYNSSSYIFLQDSVIITNPNIILEWDKLLECNDIVPMYNFNFFYDNNIQRDWALDNINCSTEPTDGIFGPIFAANKTSLDLIPSTWLKEPTTKLEACAMERRWSLIFHKLNLKKQYMVYMNINEIWDFLRGNTIKYAVYLQKQFFNKVR